MLKKSSFSFYLLASLLAYSPNLWSSSSESSLSETSYEHYFPSFLFSTPIGQFHSLGGLIHSKGPITLTGYDYITISQQAIGSPTGGTFSSESLTITRTKGNIQCIGNNTSSCGGVIHTTKDCHITHNFGYIYFGNNQASTLTQNTSEHAGGAICADSSFTLSKNHQSICFSDNFSEGKGGAIATKETCTISQNYGPILFLNNRSEILSQTNSSQSGGAIFGKQCDILENQKPIFFVSNTSVLGGAIHAEEMVNIRHNYSFLYFDKNSCASQTSQQDESHLGGGIFSKNINIDHNGNTIFFRHNTSSNRGGALCCDDLKINNNHALVFTHNRSQNGGAIYIQENGKCSISADYGNITFKNNLNIKADEQTHRNALVCAKNSEISLGAKQYYHLQFFDPILCQENKEPIVINPTDKDLGSVLFSGKYVPANAQTDDNLTSKLEGIVKLAHGVLAVDYGARLSIYKIEQTTNDLGIVRLGNGAVLGTGNKGSSTDSSLTLRDLAIHLPSLIQKEAIPPKLSIFPIEKNGQYQPETSHKITISGDLKFFDQNNESPYDTIDLSEVKTKVPLLHIDDVINKNINIDQLNIEAINQSDHYGHQGTWFPYWEEYISQPDPSSFQTANARHSFLYANWIPSGYKANPKYEAHLVANSLWVNYYTVLSCMHSFPLVTVPDYFEIGQQGTLGTVNQQTRSNIPGFRIESAGYSVGTRLRSPIALSFSQYFSHSREKTSHNRLSSTHTFGGLQCTLPKWLGFFTTTSAAYTHGQHKETQRYVKENQKSKGIFSTHSFSTNVRCSRQLRFLSQYMSLSPFVECFAFFSNISSFAEEGDHPRQFSKNSAFKLVSLPVGLVAKWEHNLHLPTDWVLHIAYRPTVYKCDPKLNVMLIESHGTWTSLGSPTSRHCLAFDLEMISQVTEHLRVVLKYQGDCSTTTYSNHLKVGSSLSF